MKRRFEEICRGPNTVRKQVIVDLGYRGVDQDNSTMQIVFRSKYRLVTNPHRPLIRGVRQRADDWASEVNASIHHGCYSSLSA